MLSISNYSNTIKQRTVPVKQMKTSALNFTGGSSLIMPKTSAGGLALLIGGVIVIVGGVILLVKNLLNSNPKPLKKQLTNHAKNKEVITTTSKTLKELKNKSTPKAEKIETTKQFLKTIGYNNKQIEKILKKAGSSDEEKIASICQWLNEWVDEYEKTNPKIAPEQPSTQTHAQEPPKAVETRPAPPPSPTKSSGSSNSRPAPPPSPPKSSGSSNLRPATYTRPTFCPPPSISPETITADIILPTNSICIAKTPDPFTVGKFTGTDSRTPNGLMDYLRREQKNAKFKPTDPTYQEAFIDFNHDKCLRKFLDKFQEDNSAILDTLKENVTKKNVLEFANALHKFIRNWDNNGAGPSIGLRDGFQSSFVGSNSETYNFQSGTMTFPLGVMVQNPQLPVCRHRAMLTHAIVLDLIRQDRLPEETFATGHVRTKGHEYNVLVAKCTDGTTAKYKIDAFSVEQPKEVNWNYVRTMRCSAEELINEYNDVLKQLKS